MSNMAERGREEDIAPWRSSSSETASSEFRTTIGMPIAAVYTMSPTRS
jgi:hypothetical protein